MQRSERTDVVNRIRIRSVVRGEGPTVVMLHGFPETHRSWDVTVPTLVEAGYRTVTPDLRGYGRSDRPRQGYDLDTLSRDVAELIEALGDEQVALVGHDWGGAIAWHTASRYPGRIGKLIVLDCPHPALMAKAMRDNARQRRRSWYMFFFQLPLLPELWLSRSGGRNLSRMFRAGSPAEHAVPSELVEAETRELLGRTRLHGPLAYYRTMFRESLMPMLANRVADGYGTIDLPVTLIWGEADSCLGVELIDGTERFAPDLTVHRVAAAGHFVHQERPEVVNPLLVEALAWPNARYSRRSTA